MMTLIDRLKRIHTRIERQIAAEQSSPGSDWSHLTMLKKSKLRIKDRLAQMQRHMAPRSIGQA